jgi:hypothetical protein
MAFTAGNLTIFCPKPNPTTKERKGKERKEEGNTRNDSDREKKQ